MANTVTILWPLADGMMQTSFSINKRHHDFQVRHMQD